MGYGVDLGAAGFGVCLRVRLGCSYRGTGAQRRDSTRSRACIASASLRAHTVTLSRNPSDRLVPRPCVALLLLRRKIMRGVLKLLAALLFLSVPALATIFGTVRGIVHDPQHRPVADATVILKAKASDYTKTMRTDAEGGFHFDAVPLGEYSVTVSQGGFVTQAQAVTVLSGTAPIFHFTLHLPTVAQSVTVSAESSPAQTESVTPTTLIDPVEIHHTPGATRSNSLAMITNYVPGAYFTHDQLHVRGGHQVSWLIDGVALPNTNIASNLGPQVHPKDIDPVEMQRGSYAHYIGDPPYGVYELLPPTGFYLNDEAA